MAWIRDLQPRVETLPKLRKTWFSNKRVCKDEGWSFWVSASDGSRIDAYHYEERGRFLTLGGEGGFKSVDVIIPAQLTWDDDLSKPIENPKKIRILQNVSAALQHMGYAVCFLYDGKAEQDAGE